MLTILMSDGISISCGVKPMHCHKFKLLSLALLGSSVLVPAVAAQDSDQVQSVYEKYRPDFSAPGVRSGGFLFYPSVAVDGEFNGNIYKTDDASTPNVNDFIAIIKPSFNLVSDWNNNYFALNAGAKVGRYTDNSTENYEDINIGASGRIDMTRGTNIFADLSFSDAHEDRGSPDTASNQAEQTTYSTLTVKGGFKRDEGLMSFAVDGSYVKANYDDAALNGGGFLNNDDRDRETVQGSVRLGYDLNDDFEAFVKFTTTKVTYVDSQQDGGPLRDNDGWDVVAGTSFDVGGKSVGEFYVGYVKRDFDGATLRKAGNISDVKFGASLLWSATELTSVRVAVDRSVTETTVTALNSGRPASGILATLYSVRMEHELRRNVLLNVNGSYTNMDYQNIGRVDYMTKVGAGMRYMFNRNFSLNADYSYDQRETGVVNQDYKLHSFIVSLAAQW